MQYDIFKSAYCGSFFGHDQIGSRQCSWHNSDFELSYDYRDINHIFRKAESYNASRAKICSCRVEVKAL